MKITTTCCLGLLVIIGTMAAAQQTIPARGLPCSRPSSSAVIDWAQFRFVPCHTGLDPYEFVLSPTTVVNHRSHPLRRSKAVPDEAPPTTRAQGNSRAD